MKTRYLLTLSLSVITLLSSSELNADSDEQSEQDTTVNISLPKVPEVEAIVVPAVNVVVDGKQNNSHEIQESDINRKIGFSKRVPPEDIEVFDPTNENVLVGEIKNSRVSAYLRSSIVSEQEVTSKLQEAGFRVLASYKLDKKGTLTSVVFADEEMVSSASKEMRGFAGTLRLLIDKESSLISISNPIYVMKAFMQDQYNHKVATETLTRLRNAFSDLEDSEDILKVTRLEKYQFMMSMPYYEDMKEVALGSNKSLLQKARKSNKVVYEQHLNNGSVVLGVDLSKRTKKFVKKIGHQNAGLLPYPVLIENGKAKILAPRYYIAVMYPMLSMSQFMGIATIPGAIEKECYKIFR